MQADITTVTQDDEIEFYLNGYFLTSISDKNLSDEIKEELDLCIS